MCVDHFIVRLACNGAAAAFKVTANSLPGNSTKFSVSNYTWLYHPGDNEAWADTLLRDNAWQFVKTDFGSGKMIPGWHGTGWFRLWFSIEPSFTYFG